MRPQTQRARRDLGYVSEIVASSFAYPSDLVDNDEYVRRCRFQPAAGWDALANESGVTTRRWCLPNENTRSMTELAIERLVAARPDLRERIDVVVVASGTTMPMAHPTDPNNCAFADLSPLVIRQLGLEHTLGLDIKACYCTGFLRGMQVVDGLLGNANYRAALLVATEQGSRFAVAETNRSAFGFIVADAAGAVVLERGAPRARSGVVDYVGYTDVSKLDWVGIGPDAASMIMLGSRAASATRDMLIECGRTLLARNGLGPGDVDWLIPIQTHRGLLAEVCHTLEFPDEKLLWTGDVTGFSGSASIPACLAEQTARGTVRPGQLVLSMAVGAGMNCAGALYYA